MDTFDFGPWKEDQRSKGRTYYRVETEETQSKVMAMHANDTRVKDMLETITSEPMTTLVPTSTESLQTTTLTPDTTTTGNSTSNQTIFT